MHLLVIGASRGIGARVVDYALGRGHRVRAFARSATAMAPHDGLETVDGDATSPDDVAAALEGIDAVLLCLGIPRHLPALARPTTLFSEATGVIVAEMSAAGLRRLLAVTGFGAGESRRAVGRILALPFEALMGRAYADKTRQETVLVESGLDWTIVRPGILTDSPMTGRYRVLVGPGTWHMGVISRADVAHFLVHAAEDGSHVHEAPVLVG